MVNDKKSFIAAISDSFVKHNIFSNVKTKLLDSGEVLFLSELNSDLYVIQTRFQLSDIGLAPREILFWLRIEKVERLLESIAVKNKLKYNYDFQHTITAGIRNKELYKTITSGKLEIDVFKELFNNYLVEEITPFFMTRGSLDGLGNFILQHDIDKISNIGLGGEYPANVLKAITIAKLCRNEPRYQEYIKGFQCWIDEDRNNPNYAKMCDDYQGALNDLKDILEK